MSSKIKNLREEKEATLLTLIPHHQANQSPHLLPVEVDKSIAKSEKGGPPTQEVLPGLSGRSGGRAVRKGRRGGRRKRRKRRGKVINIRSQRRRGIPENKIQL